MKTNTLNLLNNYTSKLGVSIIHDTVNTQAQVQFNLH